jgi:hypothetical protein
MNKEFIPYKQALALKELGFDAQCFAHYRDKESLVACNQGIYGISYSDIEEPTKVILAPLYSQAFRWFREKYDIKPCFDWHPTEEYRYCIYYSKNTYFQKCDFLTYEEAELECLKKLIEIVESKS